MALVYVLPKKEQTLMTLKAKKTGGRNSRIKGNRAERLLLEQLTQQGYGVRRTHLSLFPDIIAWNEQGFLFIEVKARTNPKHITEALYVFRNSVKEMTKLPKGANLLCYVRVNDTWRAFKSQNEDIIEVSPVVNEER